MRPKHYKKETESLHCELGGPIAHFSEIKMLRRETESLQSHLSETEIPIGETELIRVSGYGYVKVTWWCRIDQTVGPSLTLGFGNIRN